MRIIILFIILRIIGPPACPPIWEEALPWSQLKRKPPGHPTAAMSGIQGPGRAREAAFPPPKMASDGPKPPVAGAARLVSEVVT